MIRIETITIANFRGIRALAIDFHDENFAIYGPNGTGKSGVVDAIEFALTGNISRLTGRGTSGISVKEHGPHVDFRAQPTSAIVKLKAFVPRLGKSFTIERSIASPKTPVVTPDEPDVKLVIAELAVHPEFTLSRREILKYVITEPGERAKEVQALLKLEQVEKVRASLQKNANACAAEQKKADESALRSRTDLLVALKIEELKPALVLEAANLRRSTLGLAHITELSKDTSLKTGLGSEIQQQKILVSKKTALAEFEAINTALHSKESSKVANSIADVLSIFSTLEASPDLLKNLRRYSFLKQGNDMLEEALCPFCDTPWVMEDLRRRVTAKIEDAKEAHALQTRLQNLSIPLLDIMLQLHSLLSTIRGYAKPLKLVLEMSAFDGWLAELKSLREGLAKVESFEVTKKALQAGWRSLPSEVQRILDEIHKAIQSLPDISKEDEAKEFLIVAHERLEIYRKARRLQELWKRRTELSSLIFSKYSDTTKSVLTGIYQEVEKDFSRYYAIINREDEAEFRGRLAPSLGKLGFDVDFYGRGFFPPGAYHSEGHQDGMGVCLYLALMKRTLGTDFTFAVLDDVLMSVDANHRNEFCRLLKTEFPGTQLIMTTHDTAWKQNMIYEGLVATRSVLEFRRWSVEDGPHVWEYEEIWTEVQKNLATGNVSGAAQGLRRFLEYSGQQLAFRLRAPVPAQLGGMYDAGDLIPAVIGRWIKLLKAAKDAAQSWGQTESFERLKVSHEAFSKLVDRIKTNNWMINPSIHYNEWADWGPDAFRPVIEAYRQLVESFRCDKCHGFVYVEPMKGSETSVRCDCSQFNLNLRKKPSSESSNSREGR